MALPQDLPIKPPIFVGAGVIKTEERIRLFADEPLLAAQVIGSFSELEHGGADPEDKVQRFYWDEVHQAAYNAFGLNNCGRQEASRFLPDAVKLVKDVGQIAVVSVTALAHEDPTQVLPFLAEWAFDMGADRVEINGSCPNQHNDDLLCHNVDKMGEALLAIVEQVGEDAELQLKVSPLSHEEIIRYRTTARLPVSTVVAINNCRRLSPLNPVTGNPYIEVNRGFAGQSGPVIIELARENLAMWANSTGNMPGDPYKVWSIGGVDNGREVYCRVRDMGAEMVGGAQDFYRSQDPGSRILNWIQEYEQASTE